MDNLDTYIDRVQHLPPSPTTAIQLLNLFSDPDRDIDSIVDLVSHDPALTAQTLKRCNSAFFGGAEPASDMFEAVSRLGFYEVYCTVAALMASRIMKEVTDGCSLDANRLWQHTVTTAVIASVLAPRVEVLEASAFTAGLIHDIGKLLLVSVEGKDYGEMMKRKGVFGPDLAAAEQSFFGFTHAPLGARLLTRWGVPENICVAVQLHHEIPEAAGQFQKIAATVSVGNCLAHKLVDDPKRRPSDAGMCPFAMELLDMNAQEIPIVVQQAREALEKVKELFQMKG